MNFFFFYFTIYIESDGLIRIRSYIQIIDMWLICEANKFLLKHNINIHLY